MWFWLAFGSAVLGAIDLIYSKHVLKNVSGVLLAWTAFIFTIPLLLIITLIQGVPSFDRVFLLAAASSSVTFIFYKVFFFEYLKKNLASKIIPLTAFSGMFTYLIGVVLLSESIRPIPILGLLSIVFGAYILNADQSKEGLLQPLKLLFSTKGSLWFLMILFLGSTTAVFDKMAIITTLPNDPIFTLLIEQILMGILLTAYLIKKEKAWAANIKQNFRPLMFYSLIFLIAGLPALYGYITGPVALVLGVKRLQIFFALILGYLFLQDKPAKHVWIAAIIMFLGAILIKIG